MQKRRRLAAVLLALLGSASVSHAQPTILFDADSFAGSTALTTPGRQIVGGELLTTFAPATDAFTFDAGVFGAYGIGGLAFANDVIGGIPATGANVIVLRTFGPAPFGAAAAANLIADQVTTPGAGSFCTSTVVSTSRASCFPPT
jgi:hypothetical protein